MISSEVQRTLVKSPPELWTELSDPAALARHLGEFGEIQITRSEPEQIVEWESDRARGRVLLKPSGWGTKVTLTVTGELAGEDRAPTGEAPADSPTELEPVVEAPGPEATAVEAQPDPTPETPPSPAAQPDPAPETPPSPALEAPAVEAQPDPTPETPPSPASEAPAPESQLDLERDASAEPQGQDEEQEEAPPVTVRAQPAPRRGFLARLFGRGGSSEAALAEETPLPLGTPATCAGADPDAATEAEEPIVPAEETDTAETIEPVERTGAAEPIALMERTDTDEALGTVEAAGAAFGLFEPTEPPPAGQPAGALEPSPADAPEPAPGALGGLGAELRDAEETEAEQVNLVLTSVLDRLGSAHHRPFSRS